MIFTGAALLVFGGMTASSDNTIGLKNVHNSLLVSVHCAAVRQAFSSGSPTISRVSMAMSEWQATSTCTVSTGTSVTDRIAVMSSGSRPAMPSTTSESVVSVPVLSKQHTSILPARGMRNGSVQ